MLTSYKLPLNFDPVRLRNDLDRILSDDWLPHYAKLDYEHGWSSAALRSVEGSLTNQEATKGEFRDTPLLSRCPYFQEVIASFKSPTKRVRLLRLETGAVIHEHIDIALNFDLGEVRVHIPVVTDPKVEFFVDGKRVIMKEGEMWYIDTTFPHRVANLSKIDRVHLVVDCEVNDWVRSMFPSEFGGSRWQRRLAYEMRCLHFKLKNGVMLVKKDPKELRMRVARMLRRYLPVRN